MGFLKKLSLQTYVLFLLCIFPHSSFSADLCFCPEKPNGAECNNLCKDNPGGVVVFLPSEPEQPGTNPFEMPALWSAQSLEKYRQTNEDFRLLLETERINAETIRENIGSYPPSIEYKKSMADYFEGMKHYDENMRGYGTLQEVVQ